MNPLKRYLINRRLKATLRPDPEYRARRLAQFSPERRYARNVEFTTAPTSPEVTL